jgi:Domain of unknown function (DUF4184)
MPFTISHTAAVLPFGRTLRQAKLLSAAVIGSMVPDFGLFVPFFWARYETHGIVPLFRFCLPMGLLCYWIFQLHIKPATLELMPGKLHELWREEGRPASWLSWKQWVLAAIGVLLGAVTHLIWDGFTHENARGVRMLSALDDVRVAFAGRNVSWYRFLQHTSSVVGLLFVAGFVYRTIARAAEHPDSEPRILDREQRHRWFTAYAVAACIGTIIVFFLWPHPIVWRHIGFNIARAAIASIWGIALSLIVVSFFVRLEISKERARRSSAAQRGI